MDSDTLTPFPSLLASTTLVPSEKSSLQDRSTRNDEKASAPPWEDYPYSLPTYNPFTEWGEHYVETFSRDLWSKRSNFVLQDLNGDVVSKCS
jgi:hypothetical protein